MSGPTSLARGQRGVGLIEILIAVVIIAIGFLAAARMQVDSMRYSQSAYYRSQAYFMASEMIDRIRANVEGVRDGEYDSLTTSAAAVDPGCDAKDCTPAEIARQDLHDWSAYLHPLDGRAGFVPLLPSVTGFDAVGVVQRFGGPNNYLLQLNWGEIVDGQPERQQLRIDFVAES